jgi:hypothetical protein
LGDRTPQEIYFKERTEHKPWLDSTVASPYTTPIFV